MPDFSDQLTDFGETAALIACLELVITVDTAIAHLAGAMGKPCWVLLSKASDWRWFLSRTDSPWYPSVRLFRQSQSGQWTAPIQAVADALVAEGGQP
jgi:ADP-heptose:LPS heptosyltransferase